MRPPQKDVEAVPIDPTSPGAQAALREQRFRAAIDCRRRGKGVKPRQGCSSERLNRECREDTKTGQFHEFFKIVRADVDAEVRRRHGQSELEPRRAGAPRGPDYVKVLKPLSFAIEFVDQNLHNKCTCLIPAVGCMRMPGSTSPRHLVAAWRRRAPSSSRLRCDGPEDD